MTDRFIVFIQAVSPGITHGRLSDGVSNDGSMGIYATYTPALAWSNVSHLTILLCARRAEATVDGAQKQSPEVATPGIVRRGRAFCVSTTRPILSSCTAGRIERDT